MSKRIGTLLVVTLVPLAVVALVAFVAIMLPSMVGESASSGGSASSSPLRELAPVDPARPYANTPAAGWAEGEAGIVAPPPVPLGRFTAEDVGAAMARVRELIIAARLNPHVLETHDAGPVLALLAGHQAEEVRALLRPGNEAETWWVSVKIADGHRLLPVAPRVAGSMTPIADERGDLVIRTNFLIAYAFHHDYPEVLDGPMDIVAVDRWEFDYIWVQDPQYDAGSQGIYYGDIAAHSYSVNCALHDKGFLAPNYSNPPALTPLREARDPEEYFDPSVPIPDESNC